MLTSFARIGIVLLALLLSGCAANQMHGFENTYIAYQVPQPLVDTISVRLRQHGLPNARVVRDSVGRIQLAGSYQNEDEVDSAFLIVQSIVGLKSTSPFYPANIKEKRFEAEARRAMAENARSASQTSSRPGRRVALVVGINTYKNPKNFPAIPGEDDAAVVRHAAQQAGYQVTALLGPQATKHNIEKALRQISDELTPEDSLFIYISSHGTQPLPTVQGGDERKMSIIAWDSGDINASSRLELNLNLQKTAVSDTLVQRLAQRPTRNTRILIDTCYSGEMLSGLPDESQGYIARTNGGKAERAGVAMASWSGPAFTSKGIFNTASNRPVPQKAAASQHDINSERAYTIITATGEGEESLAPPAATGVFRLPDQRELRGSYFTQAFFAYLDTYKGQIEPAFAAAQKFTQDNAKQVTGNRQEQNPRQFSTRSAERSRL
ncbi:MAG: caspase family protein [Burkholderiaceae bacterium]|nr:caspase family protein [Burkholderiaceae bacterium]